MFGKKFSKSRRRRLRRAAVGTAAMVLCVFLLFAVFGCAVDQFEIVGNYHETEDEIRGMLGTGPFSNSSIVLWLLNRGRTVRGNTFVDSLTVDMEGLHAVKVNVSEKKLIGCVEYDNRYWYFDRAGVVLVETDPVTKDAGSGSGKQVSGENDTSGNRSVTVETADTEEMAGEQSGTVETVDAEEASGAKKNLSEKIFSKITGTYEMAVVPAAISDFRIMYLAGDGIIYGDEAVPEDQGDPEAEEAEGSEEYPEEASPDADTEEWSEENDFTDETAAEEAEVPYEEYEETGSEENGEADEEADPPHDEPLGAAGHQQHVPQPAGQQRRHQHRLDGGMGREAVKGRQRQQQKGLGVFAPPAVVAPAVDQMQHADRDERGQRHIICRGKKD